MRGVWLVAAGIGALVVAYGADRRLGHIQMQIGIFGGSEGWREQALAVALLGRVVMLAVLAAIFVGMRRVGPRWAAWALIGIGTLVGIAPPVLVGIHIALAPGGLPFVMLNQETAPLWDGRGVYLLWTAVGLFMIGVAGVLRARGASLAGSIPPVAVAIGAALLFALSYPVDELARTSTIELAESADAYPVYVVVGIGARIGVMAAIVALLGSQMRGVTSRISAVVLLVVGAVGLAVLPVIGLQLANFWDMGDGAGFVLDPGTAGRWLAAGILAAGLIGLLRRPTEAPPPVTAKNQPAEAVT